MKKIGLEVLFDETVDRLGVGTVFADNSRFAQIITNLTSNAIKFTDTSETKRQIKISVAVGLEPPLNNSCQPNPIHPSKAKVPEGEELFIHISVTDSGPGLDPEDLARLFQRFQQGSHSHNVFGGSGLGLFVSRQLCTLMGGRIEVLSTPGDGATFRFFIKAKTCASSSVAASGSSTPPITPIEPTFSRPIHVLLTEDNLINQTVLNRQLIKAGCTTVLASNGQQAIDALCSASKQFDAVLMDVEMPVLDGLTAVRQIRSMEARGVLPRRHRIFALTGNARPGQVQKMLDAGMDEVLIKPYRIDQVLAKLKSLE